MKKTEYRLSGDRWGRSLCFAVVADLHGGDPAEVIGALKEAKPDFILMPGDILERLNGADDLAHQRGLTLLAEASKLAPTLYSLGNHEDGSTRSWRPKHLRHHSFDRDHDRGDLERIAQTGAILLDDSYVSVNGIVFGGLSSGLIFEDEKPRLSWLEAFCREAAPKVLLCHHPEYYRPYLRDLPVDLIVSGHAHGGQWRFFGRGVFSPGQGILPKYTAGVHDGHFVISTGLKKGGTIPRFFNEPEVVFIHA